MTLVPLDLTISALKEHFLVRALYSQNNVTVALCVGEPGSAAIASLCDSQYKVCCNFLDKHTNYLLIFSHTSNMQVEILSKKNGNKKIVILRKKHCKNIWDVRTTPTDSTQLFLKKNLRITARPKNCHMFISLMNCHQMLLWFEIFSLLAEVLLKMTIFSTDSQERFWQ